MAYAFRRENKGTPSFTGVYEGPDGSRRSAGTFPSRRAALRAAQREEQAVREGKWRDRSLGEITFEGLCREQLVPQQTSRGHDSRCVPVLSRSALPAVLRQPVDGQDLAVVGPGVGDQDHCGGAISSVGSQVSRHAALDL